MCHSRLSYERHKRRNLSQKKKPISVKQIWAFLYNTHLIMSRRDADYWNGVEVIRVPVLLVLM